MEAREEIEAWFAREPYKDDLDESVLNDFATDVGMRQVWEALKVCTPTEIKWFAYIALAKAQLLPFQRSVAHPEFYTQLAQCADALARKAHFPSSPEFDWQQYVLASERARVLLNDMARKARERNPYSRKRSNRKADQLAYIRALEPDVRSLSRRRRNFPIYNVLADIASAMFQTPDGLSRDQVRNALKAKR